MRLRILSKDMQRINRNARVAKWRRWFAWHPARVNGHIVIWLETLYRRGGWRTMDLYGRKAWVWEYSTAAVHNGTRPYSDAPPPLPRKR